MATKRRAHDEEAWRNAKKICRLNARQIEMARRLGMNPKKLPGLRPSPQQRSKLPVGAFIEERYWNRFGGRPIDRDGHAPEPASRKPSTLQQGAEVPKRVLNSASGLGDLVCYLMNLADDLQKWLAHGSLAPEVLPQVGEELREIAAALDTGAPVHPIPGIALPPRPTRPASSRHDDQERTFDDEIPF